MEVVLEEAEVGVVAVEALAEVVQDDEFVTIK
jgi:hypothetical protein